MLRQLWTEKETAVSKNAAGNTTELQNRDTKQRCGVIKMDDAAQT